MSFTFGSDPEFMIQSEKGRLVSAIGVVPGTKYERHKLGEHEYYYDNVLAECAVAPGSTKEEFIRNLRDCLTRFTNLVKPHRLITRGAANYPTDQLTHEEARKIGCDPEYCCYEMIDIHPDETKFAQQKLRTAGGHIHLGTEVAKNGYGCFQLVRMLDLFLGIPSIYIDHDPTAQIRKKWYGKAGRFRAPEHGCEYRSLSDFWLASPTLVGLIYDICEFTIQFVEEGKDQQWWAIDKEVLDNDDSWGLPNFNPANYHRCVGYDSKAMRKAIDKMDPKLGQKFMDLIKTQMPSKLFKKIENAMAPKDYDLYTEWKIKV